MARKTGHDKHAGGGAERWLLTYADMITLLLALFIVLFSMSTIDVIKFDAFKNALSNEFHGAVMDSPGSITDGSKSALNPDSTRYIAGRRSAFSVFETPMPAASQDLAKVQESVKKLIDDKNLKEKLEVTTTERGVVIRLAGDAFFDSGSAHINERMLVVVQRVAFQLQDEFRDIAVEGHTDGQPIATAQFPSNWELSSARALAILHELRSHGVTGNNVRAVAFADTTPLVKPKFAKQAVRQNRRVEIIIFAPGAEARDAVSSNIRQEAANATKGQSNKNTEVAPAPFSPKFNIF